MPPPTDRRGWPPAEPGGRWPRPPVWRSGSHLSCSCRDEPPGGRRRGRGRPCRGVGACGGGPWSYQLWSYSSRAARRHDEDGSMFGIEAGGAGAPAPWPEEVEPWDTASAEVLDGRAAGTPTATMAAVATVPASRTFERPSGIGASPSSHCDHCFIACSQLFIACPFASGRTDRTGDPTPGPSAQTGSRGLLARPADLRSCWTTHTSHPPPIPLGRPHAPVTVRRAPDQGRCKSGPDVRPALRSGGGATGHRDRRGEGQMAIKVIQWATGGVGRAAVAGIVAHPELELVGCWVHSPDKVGGTPASCAASDRSAWPPPTTSMRSWPSGPTASSTHRSWPTPRWWPGSWRRGPTW